MKLKKIGKYYHAEFKTSSGSTRTVTTRATERSEALRIAKEAGVPELEHAAKAGRLTNQVIGRIVTGRKLTLEKAIQEFHDWQRNIGKSERTIGNRAAIFRAWFDWGKALASMPPSAITEKHINNFVNRTDIRAGAGQRTLMLVAFRSLFEFFNAKGWTVGNPARLVAVNYDLLSHAQKETKKVLPFTDAEYRRLIDYIESVIDDSDKFVARIQRNVPSATPDNTPHLDTHSRRAATHRFWLFAARLAWETGLRMSDVASLEWDSFQISGKIIVHTGKTNKRVAVPISDEIMAIMTDIPLASTQYLFPEQRQRSEAVLSLQFTRICQRAGLHKGFHSLRHTFASRMKREGKTLADIGQLLGHSNTKTTSGYVH